MYNFRSFSCERLLHLTSLYHNSLYTLYFLWLIQIQTLYSKGRSEYWGVEIICGSPEGEKMAGREQWRDNSARIEKNEELEKMENAQREITEANYCFS
jgi:hypothetical protein